MTAGVLELTPDQIRRRQHNLKVLKDGRCEIINTVEFKQGEVIGYEGAIPKSLADAMIDPKEKAKKQNKKETKVAKIMGRVDKLLATADELKLKAEADGVTDEAKAEANAEIERLLAEAETLETEANALTE